LLDYKIALIALFYAAEFNLVTKISILVLSSIEIGGISPDLISSKQLRIIESQNNSEIVILL